MRRPARIPISMQVYHARGLARYRVRENMRYRASRPGGPVLAVQRARAYTGAASSAATTPPLNRSCGGHYTISYVRVSNQAYAWRIPMREAWREGLMRIEYWSAMSGEHRVASSDEAGALWRSCEVITQAWRGGLARRLSGRPGRHTMAPDDRVRCRRMPAYRSRIVRRQRRCFYRRTYRKDVERINI
jgi:hypothetical protein